GGEAGARARAGGRAARGPMLAPGIPGCHAVTWGWLASELALRAYGSTLGAVICERLAGPLGLDLRLGLEADDPLAERLVRPQLGPDYRLTAFMAAEPDPRLERVYANPRVAIDSWADPDLLAIEASAV